MLLLIVDSVVQHIDTFISCLHGLTMLTIDAVTTLAGMAKLLYDVSQEVQESPRECEIICNHAEMLVNTISRSAMKSQRLSETMQTTITRVTE